MRKEHEYEHVAAYIVRDAEGKPAHVGGVLFEPSDTYCEINIREAREGDPVRREIIDVTKMEKAYKVSRQDHPEVAVHLLGGPDLVFPAVTSALDAIIKRYTRKPLEVAVRPNPAKS